MHRTQLLLEDWQYQKLTKLARVKKRSLAEIIREWISERLKTKAKKNDPLFAAIGMIKGKKSKTRISENVDAILYGKKE